MYCDVCMVNLYAVHSSRPVGERGKRSGCGADCVSNFSATSLLFVCVSVFVCVCKVK